jgi:hypothetical protein
LIQFDSLTTHDGDPEIDISVSLFWKSGYAGNQNSVGGWWRFESDYFSAEPGDDPGSVKVERIRRPGFPSFR